MGAWLMGVSLMGLTHILIQLPILIKITHTYHLTENYPHEPPSTWTLMNKHGAGKAGLGEGSGGLGFRV